MENVQHARAEHGAQHAESVEADAQFAFADNRAASAIQRRLIGSAHNSAPVVAQRAASQRANRTGMPDELKSGVENLSGVAMDDVRVHYNSAEPAQLQALAFAQGNDIHIGPGQERHLPHEAWHVVQQKQGRVQPTVQMKAGVRINDDSGLEHEADVMGAKALQTKTPQGNSQAKHATPTPVIQAIRSVATFQGQTPWGFGRPRKSIKLIDTALNNYITAGGANKLAMAQALHLAITNYRAQPMHINDPDQDRMNATLALDQELTPELTLLTDLGAPNGLLFDDVVARIGGLGNLAQLTPISTRLGPQHSAQLPHLIALVGGLGGLGHLDALVNHITAPNAYLLPGLIPLAGGVGNLQLLDNLINHITAANVMQLYQLIPSAGGGGAPALTALDNLIVAMGVANVGPLNTMIANAGGAASVPLLTGAINLNHPGHGNLAVLLTQAANNVHARFAELTTALPRFEQQAPPGVVPGNVLAEVANFNNSLGCVTPLPGNRHIGAVAFDHFLTRHTHRYFNFGAISPTNDQWPFFGGGTEASVAGVLVAALQNLRGVGAGGPGMWWINPNNARQVNGVGGGYDVTVGVIINGGIVDMGQFFPRPPNGGTLSFTRADMQAIQPLL